MLYKQIYGFFSEKRILKEKKKIWYKIDKIIIKYLKAVRQLFSPNLVLFIIIRKMWQISW